MSAQVDIIVIGAGIAGTSAASALSENNSVVVLERESQPGYHSTGRSAATWAPFYGPEVIRELTALSYPLLSNPCAEFADSAFTSGKGELVVCPHSHQDELDHHLALGMQRLSATDALNMVPLLKLEANDQVLYTDQMLDIDVDRLHQAYIQYTRQQGGELICNAEVKSIEHIDSQWHVVTTQGDWVSPVVINAAGAWADEIAKLAKVTPVGIQPKRRSAALVPFLDEHRMADWPMIFGAGESFYCTPFGNGLMISPADETDVDPCDIWPEELDIAKGIDEFQRRINYDVERVVHKWAGLRNFAPDGNPVVGFDKQADGFFWLAGQGGYGIQTSPALAALCKSLIEGDKIASPVFDGVSTGMLCESLAPSRFSDRQAAG